MQARILPFVPTMLDSSGRAMGVGRGAGLHLTEVLRYMREGVDQKFAKVVAAGQGNTGFMNAGFMFEMWVEQALSRYVGYGVRDLVSPGEMEIDGIKMNPDKYHVRDEKVIEFKATWKSLRKIEVEGEIVLDAFEELFYYYRWQVMAYCHGLGCLEADVVVWFVNGDYSYKEPRGGPQFRVIQMAFEPQELLDNWRNILANAEGLRRQRKAEANGKTRA